MPAVRISHDGGVHGYLGYGVCVLHARLDTYAYTEDLHTQRFDLKGARVEPTNKQIDRQDLVDNAIFDLINDLNPSQEKIEWNITMISDARMVIENWLVHNLKVCTHTEFYP